MEDVSTKYDVIARSLHWVSALVILWATVSGLFILQANVDEHIKHQIVELNVSITFVFIPLFFWRIIHRMKHGVPSYRQLLSEHEVKMAKAMHILLYALVSIVLLSGVFMMEKDFTVFYLFSISHLIDDVRALEMFKFLHMYSSRILAVCVVLHLLALVKHEVTGKRILKRVI